MWNARRNTTLIRRSDFAVPDISVVRRSMKNRRPVKRYVIDGKMMEPRDLRQLHRHMLEADSISSISDELRNLVESEWPCLRTSFRRKNRKNEHPLGCGAEEYLAEKSPAMAGLSCVG